MAEEFLDGADIIAAFEEVSSKGMPEGMAGCPLLYPRPADGVPHGPLHGGGENMMTAALAAYGVGGDVRTMKNKLPGD